MPLDDRPITVLFGPSGAGKTTLLRCVAGLERIDEGLIAFRGTRWDDGRSCLPPQRRRIAFLSQETALFPHLDVEGNVGFALASSRRAARVKELLDEFGIAPLAKRRPDSLSGGERQRVALARALAAAPQLLLLDEPLSALDAAAREALRGELRARLEAMRIPAIVVTHDRGEALALGDRMAVMIGGRIRQFGGIAEVFSAPSDAEVARSVGVESVVPATIEGEGVEGMVRLRAGAASLWAVAPAAAHGGVFACIRAGDVVIERHVDGLRSTRNHLEAVVVRVVEEEAVCRVSLDCGFPLSAIVTRQAARELGLAPGERVIASVKATSITVVAR